MANKQNTQQTNNTTSNTGIQQTVPCFKSLVGTKLNKHVYNSKGNTCTIISYLTPIINYLQTVQQVQPNIVPALNSVVNVNGLIALRNTLKGTQPLTVTQAKIQLAAANAALQAATAAAKV